MPAHLRPRTPARPTSVALALALTGGTLATLAAPASAAPAGGALLYGLTDNNGLLRFRTEGAVSAAQTITGLDAGDQVVGIDVRPATGGLYAVAQGSAGGDDNLYLLNPDTAQASKIGGALSPRLQGARFDIDVNPVSDVLRVVGESDQNLRVSLSTGAVAVDDDLSNPPVLLFGAPDAKVTGAAYTNSIASATSTTLFDLDVTRNLLQRQDPPNSGDLNSGRVLASPAPTDGTEAGFDIDGLTGTGYAVLDVDGERGLYSIDVTASGTAAARLGSFTLPGVIDLTVATPRVGIVGAEASATTAEPAAAQITVTRVGDLSEAITVPYSTTAGTADAGADYTAEVGTVTFAAGASTATLSIPITDDAVIENSESFQVRLGSPADGAVLLAARTATVTITNDDQGTLLYGVTDTNTLAQIRTLTGLVGTPQPIIGLAAGEKVVGIDYRPATGQLIAVAKANNGLASIYAINTVNTQASKLASLSKESDGTSIVLAGSRYAVDINPVSDALRIISDTGQNLRADLTDGSTVIDGELADTPTVTAAAYTNSTAAPTTTALFDLDTATDSLAQQIPPNDGTLVTRAPLGVDVANGSAAGYDIDGATGIGYATLTLGGQVGLYRIEASQRTTTEAAATRIGAFTLPDIEGLTVATPRIAVADASAAEGQTAVITVTRTGDTSRPATVGYATGGGTATAGTDYAAVSGTLAFAAGEVTRTFSVATATDNLAEPDETVTLTLSNPSGPAIVSRPATLTITNVGGSTTPPPAGKIDTSLTIQATPFLRWPDTPTITGVLRDASGAPLAGRQVLVFYKQQAVRGTAAFRPVLTLTTNAQGVYFGAIRPTVNAVWRAVYFGSATEQLAASRYDVTKMQITNPTVNGFGSTLTVRSGTQVNVSGRVLPGNVRHPVVLQWIRPDGIFNLTRLSRADSRGFYVSSRVFDRRGTYRLRILGVNTDHNVHSASRTFVLRVV